ncbi:MAG: XisI protein [Moorea sp. SIOASIH]|uniref:XisI protein n=1 Tax=Moorena sp. SIOASIH TaxID=2607817 RepID=UPI0013BC4118|nr:XisI protein [Moorena sp. SIOASIH]NEO38974.1 XisI protein [Moorena sp. SIOASIH]
MAINNYTEIIQTVIREQAELHQSGYVPIETILDIERHHYLLLQVGWVKDHWVYGSILHLDIIDGKIYIQQNNTEQVIAQRLVELGVPKTDIVIGFHSPFKRQFTDYALS